MRGVETDRQAAIDVVVAYANALDARDWAGFRALFEERVAIDYASIGSIEQMIAADDWVDRCRVLGAFDATQHKVSNFVVALDGDRASVTAYVDAAHFVTDGNRVLEGYARGTYLHQLRRGPGGGWRIAACRFTVAGYPGGKAAFDAAFVAARAAFAAQNPAKGARA